mmetsp:Transcript_3677/g.11825  ORF Transcript_3677/g.11825 Transcript_3677/m.11825 type:complete len:200 (-) Transcript_3677:715-1314(-)
MSPCWKSYTVCWRKSRTSLVSLVTLMCECEDQYFSQWPTSWLNTRTSQGLTVSTEKYASRNSTEHELCTTKRMQVASHLCSSSTMKPSAAEGMVKSARPLRLPGMVLLASSSEVRKRGRPPTKAALASSWFMPCPKPCGSTHTVSRSNTVERGRLMALTRTRQTLVPGSFLGSSVQMKRVYGITRTSFSPGKAETSSRL